jgi:DNA-binding NarL/FixJ family response regulator
LSEADGITVVGEASGCRDGCSLISSRRPNLVIFDLELGDACGSEVIARFRDHFPGMAAVIYTNCVDREMVIQALDFDIQGYLLKTSPERRLIEAVEHVARGRGFLDPYITSTVLSGSRSPAKEQPDERARLSPRELTILWKLAAGARNQHIASALHITERTVKFHVSSILRRLGATNRTEAVYMAEQMGLLEHGEQED